MVGKGQISGKFWYQAEWVPFAMTARHPIGNVINYVVLKKSKDRYRVNRERQKNGGNRYYKV